MRTPVEVDDVALQRRFDTLVSEWKLAVAAMSSVMRMVMHPAYQRIIGLGPRAVPLLLQELERDPHHWFWALNVITGEDPVPAECSGDMRAVREAWLEWGRSKGLLQ